MMIKNTLQSIKKIILLLFIFISFSQINAQELSNFKNEKWIKINGSIGASANAYKVWGIDARRVPFSWLLFGNATATIKGVSLPFSFQYSEQQRDFRQPFNMFGVSPTYKNLRIELGWRTMQFSNYTLNNHLFLGAGFTWNPKIFRVGMMYGRFLKAVQEDANQQVFNKVSQYPFAAYNRFGYTIKLGIGNEKRFVDVIYFKAKDDIKSVVSNPKEQNTSPGENVSIGIKNKITFAKYFWFESDAAVSAVTRDLRGDSVSLDKQTQKFANILLQPNFSTQVYYAVDASINFKKELFAIQAKLSRIMPDFRSFGTYYLQTDLQRITINPSYNSKKGKFSLNISAGTEHDDLASKKLQKTSRTIGNLNMLWRPTNLSGINVQLGNYGTTQQPGRRSINDTQRLDQVTQNVIFSPYKIIMGKKSTSQILYMFSLQQLNDKNKINSQNFSMNVMNNTISFNSSNNTTNRNFDVSVFYINSTLPNGNANNIGASFGLGKSSRTSLNWTWNNTFSTNSFNGKNDGFTIQSRINGTYRIGKKQQFTGAITFINNESTTNSVSKSFQEILGTLTYNYIFN